MAISDTYQETVEFLSEPKNLNLAFDLSETLPTVLDKFHIKFWDRLKAVIAMELGKMRIADWTVEFDNDDGAEDFAKPKSRNESYQYLSISPKLEIPLYCAFFVEQSFEIGKPFPDLYYGYGFNKDLRKSDRIRISKNSGIPIEEQKDEEWIKYRKQLENGSWLACKNLPYKLRARHETVMLADGDSLERNVADAMLNLFKEKRIEVEKINTALRKLKIEPPKG